MDGIWIGGKYIPCNKVTTYFCSFKNNSYYYGDGSARLYCPIPAHEKSLKSFEPMKHAAPVILAFWSKEDESA